MTLTTLLWMNLRPTATVDAQASVALASASTGVGPLAFSVGGDVAVDPVLVSLVEPGASDFYPLSLATAQYILGLDDRTDVWVVADVVMPQLLDLVTEDLDNDEYATYWLLRRWFTLPQLQQPMEPIRAKVAQTQDISLLTDDERRTVRTLNNLYNDDVNAVVWRTEA